MKRTLLYVPSYWKTSIVFILIQTGLMTLICLVMNKLRSHSFIYAFSSSVLLLLLLCLFVLQGCKDSLDEEIENPNLTALLATKSVAVVCVDVFAYWNGEQIYIGTACSSGGSSGGGGSGGVDIGGIGSGYEPDDIIVTNPYDAGGTVSGGGGSSVVHNQNTGNTEYAFRLISKIYTINSNLNLAQKAQLVYILGGCLNTPSGRMLYNLMYSRNVKISFIIDPNINYPALYNATTKSLKIRDFDALTYQQLEEEIIHAVQDQIFYLNTMDNKIKNYEFEAKVFFDLAAIVDGTGLGHVPTYTDSNPAFRYQYETWIRNIQDSFQGRFTDINGYNSLCQLWNGYSGTFDSSVSPELLSYFFRKPIPPQPPLP